MKISDIKANNQQASDMLKQVDDLLDSDPNAAKEMFDAAHQVRQQNPQQFRHNDLLKDMDGFLKNLLQNDPEGLEALQKTADAIRKISTPGLDNFSDDTDVDDAIERANKLKAMK